MTKVYLADSRGDIDVDQCTKIQEWGPWSIVSRLVNVSFGYQYMRADRLWRTRQGTPVWEKSEFVGPVPHWDTSYTYGEEAILSHA